MHLLTQNSSDLTGHNFPGQSVPDLQWFDLGFLDFTMGRNPNTVSRNGASDFECESFPGQWHADRSSLEAGQGSQRQLPASHAVTRVSDQ